VSDKGSLSRTSWPLALLAIVCVGAVVGVLTGATRPLSATRFANTGHWGYNSVRGMVFHVDGATTNIDARLEMYAEAGSQVLQSDTKGFVVGRGRITEFDKGSLSPGRSVKPPTNEPALGLEVVGGPYAVYRKAGRIVRLGDPTAIISTGGAIGTPVVTDDGTMWFHRTGNGQICRLTKDAVKLSGCPVSARKDHPGAMTVVDGRPAFVDLFTSRLHTIDGATLGDGVPLGVRLSPTAKPAARGTAARLAILDPVRGLVLVDTRAKPEKPVTVALPTSDYDGPVAAGDVVVLVDRQKDVVVTVGVDNRTTETPIEKKAGEPRLSQGEDERIYVEDADGTEVLVVGEDGGVREVDVTGKPTTPTEAPTETPTPGPPTDRDPRAGPETESDRPEQTTPPPVPPSRPGAPLAVTARPGDGSATVTWNAAPENRAPITSYQVTWQTGSITLGPGARQTPVSNLTNGVSYTFTVTATNRVGTGPGASTPPVTPAAPVPPVTPAAPPVNLRPDYDVNARPTQDVTLTWGQPALGGGTLMHYEVTATGQATRQVTETRTVYEQVQATQAITFTVRAVTRAPDGRTLVGEPATAVHEAAPGPTVNLRKGELTEEHCGDAGDDCAWMHVELVGFAPNTSYHIQPFSSHDGYHNDGHRTSTDDSGFADINEFAYSGPGDSVWVVVTLPDGSTMQSDPIVW
jgi:Fibronectin type III domain